MKVELLLAFKITNTLLSQIGNFYNIDYHNLKFEGGFENLFYSYLYEKKEFLVRIKTHVNLNTKTYQEIRAEVNWINYLAQNGVPVSVPQLSVNNNFVEEVINEKKNYTIVAFQKALGNYVNFRDPEEWNTELWEKMGEIIGRMHKLSINYCPDENFKRAEFEEDVFLKFENILDKKTDELIIKDYSQMIKWLSILPKPKNNYGMVHGDLNWGNYYIQQKKDLTIFDFDSCCYNWFIYDIAIFLYSLIWEDNSEKAISFLKQFIPVFYKGYKKNLSLSVYWIRLISEFLYLHDFFLYTAITETVNAGNTVEDYPTMLKIIRKRCISGISKSYFTENEWIDLFGDKNS